MRKKSSAAAVIAVGVRAGKSKGMVLEVGWVILGCSSSEEIHISSVPVRRWALSYDAMTESTGGIERRVHPRFDLMAQIEQAEG